MINQLITEEQMNSLTNQWTRSSEVWIQCSTGEQKTADQLKGEQTRHVIPLREESTWGLYLECLFVTNRSNWDTELYVRLFVDLWGGLEH